VTIMRIATLIHLQKEAHAITDVPKSDVKYK